MNISTIKHDIKTMLMLVKMDFTRRYMGTMLGAIWALLMPLCTIILIYFVLSYGLKISAIGEVSFVNWLVPGMLVWFFMSDCISSGTGVIMDYPYLVTKMKFPVRLLIPARLCAAMPVHALLMFMFMLVLLVEGKVSFVYWLQLPYYFICACALCLAITMFTSAAQVFVRDMANVVAVILQALFWATPLFWNPQLIKDTKFFFILYSPFNYIVTGYRDSLVHGVAIWQRPSQTIAFWLITGIIFLIGYKVFKRSRPHFADVL